ncbi:acyl-CoA thioesterase [candidate division KSB1 bacterium]|nr:acyl-CoA thioesterase [candidate division KSB1 bacterium]
MRVRYADTDQMGVVYHGRYLEWFEAARTEMLRHHGLPYKELEAQGISLPVIGVNCRYHRPVRYDDFVVIQTKLSELSRLKLKLEYHLFVQDDSTLCAEAITWHCFLNKDGRPIRVSKEVLHFFNQLIR